LGQHQRIGRDSVARFQQISFVFPFFLLFNDSSRYSSSSFAVIQVIEIERKAIEHLLNTNPFLSFEACSLPLKYVFDYGERTFSW